MLVFKHTGSSFVFINKGSVLFLFGARPPYKDRSNVGSPCNYYIYNKTCGYPGFPMGGVVEIL